MTSMGLRPYETTNPTRFSSHTRKSRRTTHKNLPTPPTQHRGAQYAQPCTINTNFEQNFARPTHFKSQEEIFTQGYDYVDSRRFGYTVESGNSHNHSYNTCKYDKKPRVKSNSSGYDKNAWLSLASTASESDGSSSHSSSGSQLSGFKIVQKGKVLHNETVEEVDWSPASKYELTLKRESSNGRFASSVMVTGPNVKEISIPTFA